MPATADFSTLSGLPYWPSSTVDETLLQWWQALPPPKPLTLAIAFSGGADSTALLLAALRLSQKKNTDTSRAFPQKLVALHVNHGLQPSADAFSLHCEQICAALLSPAQQMMCTLTFISLPLQITLDKGDSIEAKAREARYQALAYAAQEAQAPIVLLGQHAGDQTESVLLALSRGAGMAGLAAMPSTRIRHGVHFARPLLSLPQETLKSWLQMHHVTWIEDPSNTNLRFTRNRLRHTVLPMLEKYLPGFNHSLARSARLAAQAEGLLQDLAQIDLQQIGNPPEISMLQQLSPPRQANVLRYWLKTEYGVIGRENQMQALLQVLSACTTRGHQIHIKVGNGFVLRNGAVLTWKLLQS